MRTTLSIDPLALENVCRRHRIRRLALFGSVLKGHAHADSDIDFLVEFLQGARPTFLDMAQIELDLSPLVGGRRVDVRTAEDLSRYFRDEVTGEAEVHYVAG